MTRTLCAFFSSYLKAWGCSGIVDDTRMILEVDNSTTPDRRLFEEDHCNPPAIAKFRPSFLKELNGTSSKSQESLPDDSEKPDY